MRNVLTNHRFDINRAITAAMSTCASDSKALMSASKGLSTVKQAADHSEFGYIPISDSNENCSVYNYAATSSVPDEHVYIASYSDDWTQHLKEYKIDWAFDSRWYGYQGYWIRCYASSWYWINGWYYYPSGTSVWKFWFNPCYDDSWLSYSPFAVAKNGRYIYYFALTTADENRCSWVWVVYLIDTLNKTCTDIWHCNWWRCRSGWCRFYETKDKVRVYFNWTFSWSYSEWGYLEVDKNAGTCGSFVSLGYDNTWTYMSAHPNGEYDNFDSMNLLTNLWTTWWRSYFCWVDVGSWGYFQRGWDNKNKEYIYRPVNITTWNATQWAAIQ